MPGRRVVGSLLVRASCAFLVVGCSRSPTPLPGPAAASALPAPPAPPSPPSGAGATLRLATALEDVDAGAAEAGAVAPPSLAGKTVLHVGDSMVGGNQGLSRALEQRFTAEGAKFVRDYKVSESVVSYDHSPKLRSLVDRHHPDIVIITLGTNDVFVPYPAAMVGNIQSIVKRVAGRECYWMGPPTWKPDTGIVSVLKENVAPCKFFDGSSLKLARGGDGIHPTDRGGAEWAASFWGFFRAATAPLPGGADAGR